MALQGADRIDSIALMDKSGKEQNYGLNGPQTRELAKAHSLEYVVAFNGWNLTVTGSDVPEDVQANYFTGNLFQMLGVPALIGRSFGPSDAPDGQDPQPVVVLSNKFWMHHYNGDGSVVGKTIQLVRKTYTVIGVMPPHFGFPVSPGPKDVGTSTAGRVIYLFPMIAAACLANAGEL